MKATLEFELPEEREEFHITSKAMDLSNQLYEIYNFTRSQLKHHDHPEETQILLERIKDIAWQDD